VIAKLDRNSSFFLFFFIFGLVYVFYSSQLILNPNSFIHLNDEGYYLGLRRPLFDPRYGFFSCLVSIYFFFIESPFWVAIIHKSLMLCAFMMFWPSLITRYGLRIFTLLYFSFIFINSFFLRDSLIFLFCLFALMQKKPTSMLLNGLVKIPILLTRPQVLILFLTPWLSIVITIAFILFYRDIYAANQLRDNGLLTIFNEFFWRDVLLIVPVTISNLNPLKLLNLWIQNNYINLLVLTLSSLSIFVVFGWIILAFFREQYRNIFWSRLLCGLICFFVLYGSIGIPIDKRVFIASLSPFLILVPPSLLKMNHIIIILCVWVLMFLSQDLFRLWLY
jgi:hypothetical protein